MTRHDGPVLVVEDEPDIREMMVALLESRGYAVAAAADGADALAQLRAGRAPCLILLDLMMPVMDGWTFCREKGRDPALAGIPVIVVSAVSRQDRRNQALPVVEHISKPIQVESLLAAVARFC
ncbi:MAG TPA: response regulator [Polyangiaceae bacterium]|nr:response regulator [Polyangiaceae bacterium]